jgi:glutamate synthase domain-containing protein 3
MSGGIAYIYDLARDFAGRCNTESVSFEAIDDGDAAELHALISEHALRTDSAIATHVLAHWAAELPRFVKVMPDDYRRALDALAPEEFSLPEEFIALEEVIDEVIVEVI